MPDLPKIALPSGYKPQSLDTSVEADLFLFKRFCQMPLWKKAQLITGVTTGCRRLGLIGIKTQYPQATPIQIKKFYIERVLGAQWTELTINQAEVMIGDPIALALLLAEILERLQIPYFIGGSIASSLWGESRATLDLDLVADFGLEQVSAFLQAVETQFYISEDALRDAITRHASFNLIHLDTNEKVDIFILSPQPLSQQEMQRRQLKQVEEEGRCLYLASPEDIILQKLIWYRLGNYISERQWRDILGVLKAQGTQLDFSYLRYWSQQEKLLELLERALIEAGLNLT